MGIQTVGVIGAGVMGVGVGQDLARSGHRVLLLDVSDDALQRARAALFRNLRFQRLYARGEAGGSPEAILDRVTFTTDYRLLEKAEFVIENATERWETKRAIYPRIDAICPAGVVFAANTSCLPITSIAALTERAPLVLGIHFMNPVPLKPTVEMIRGYHTSDDAIGAANELLARMGKSAVLVNDAPGFVSNRVLMLAINEAFYVLHDQVASPDAVDRIFKECFSHKMGPLETAELIGLDTILHSIEALHRSFGDSKYRPCPLLQRMVDAGFLGRKNCRGVAAYFSHGVQSNRTRKDTVEWTPS
jgi:3-hydroxybutyryl-CoA dehydrogenase